MATLPHTLQSKVPLAQFTTFSIGGPARFYADLSDFSALSPLISFAHEQNMPIAVIGGGSNILVSDRGIPGLVLRITARGITTEETKTHALLRAPAGELWDDIVAIANEREWWGIENLSLIPGTAGGGIIQNIGAYGQEISSVVSSVEAVHWKTGKTKIFSPHECRFGYRTSFFKEHLGEYLISTIAISLSRQPNPVLTYPDVARRLGTISHPSLADIRNTIIAIRKEKLPDPNREGNAGSFFKNLVLNPQEFNELSRRVRKSFGDRAHERLLSAARTFSRNLGQYKIPTALLIDLCGLKGYEQNGVAVSPKQPLVLTNKSGKASARDVLLMFRHVRRTVYRYTSALVEPEPILLGFSSDELEEFFSLP